MSVAQEDMKPPVPSKVSKDTSVSRFLAEEHLPSPAGTPVPSTSKQEYVGTSPSPKGH